MHFVDGDDFDPCMHHAFTHHKSRTQTQTQTQTQTHTHTCTLFMFSKIGLKSGADH